MPSPYPKRSVKAWRLGIALCALAASFVGRAEVTPCECSGPTGLRESFYSSSGGAVFVGRVTSLEQGAGTLTAATFRVSRAWKGVTESTAVVYTEPIDGTCAFPFEKGKEYLVFASVVFNPQAELTVLMTSICHRTSPLGLAKADLAELESLHEPVKVFPAPKKKAG